MSRTVSAAILTALAQPEVQPFYAIEFNFDTAPLYFWTGYGGRVIEGNNYLGTGNLLTIGGLEEAADLSAKSVTITLSGVPSDIVSLALSEPYQRRTCRILFGVQNVDAIVEVFSGVMNTMTIQDSGETSTIELLVESKLVELERAKIRRYTHESQQARYPNDTFFSYVTALQDKDVIWGRKG
tara:strand:- start:3684 stop:4232 length:549 start_codon:yes stop_codon:yes gene_type:complete